MYVENFEIGIDYFKTDGASCLILFSVKDPNQNFVRIIIFYLCIQMLEAGLLNQI